MEAWLVAVIVRAAETGECISYLAAAEDALSGLGEDAVQPCIELIPAHSRNERVRILWNVVGVLHRIALLETSPGLVRIEIVNPAAILSARADEFQIIIENLRPAIGEFHQLPVIIFLAQLFGKLSCGVCAETVLQCMGNGECRTSVIGHETRVSYIRHIAFLHELAHVHLAGALNPSTPFEIVLAGSLVHLFNVKVADATVVCTGKGNADHVGADS